MKKTRAKGSERPLLSAAKRLRAWYMWARSWNTCFSVGKGRRRLGAGGSPAPSRGEGWEPGAAQAQKSPLTRVDQADGWEGVQAQALGRLDLLEAAGQATQEVLALLAEAQPQVELQLGLHRPARRAEAPFPWQLGVGSGSAAGAHGVRKGQGAGRGLGPSCPCSSAASPLVCGVGVVNTAPKRAGRVGPCCPPRF